MSLPTYNNIQYILVAVSFLGFTFFDLLYIAVTVNYCSQCQLLTFYIDNLQDKVRNKKYPNLKVAMIVSSECVITNIVVVIYTYIHTLGNP